MKKPSKMEGLFFSTYRTYSTYSSFKLEINVV